MSGLAQAATDLEHATQLGTVDSVAVYGALLLRGAIAAARAEDRDTAGTMLDEAERAAARLGQDGNDRWTGFGPNNVLQHRVTVALDLGDAGTAIAFARQVRVDKMRFSASPSRLPIASPTSATPSSKRTRSKDSPRRRDRSSPWPASGSTQPAPATRSRGYGRRVRMVAVDDGVRLRTWTTGSATGLPAVVLLHGGPGLWDYLAPVARMLEPLTTVHRFDQRGCGGSDESPEHTIARYLADIEALRRHWGHDSWVVVGHSFGATLALAYAGANPERTYALGYLGGTGVGDWRSAAREEQMRRMTAHQQQRLAELQQRPDRSPADEVEFRALSWFTDFADPDDGWRWALEDARVDRPINWTANRSLTAETRRWSDADVLARARRLAMPCWFIHGDQDPRPVRTVAALAGAIPAGQLHLIAGAGHQPWRERPGELRTLLHGFIRAE